VGVVDCVCERMRGYRAVHYSPSRWLLYRGLKARRMRLRSRVWVVLTLRLPRQRSANQANTKHRTFTRGIGAIDKRDSDKPHGSPRIQGLVSTCTRRNCICRWSTRAHNGRQLHHGLHAPSDSRTDCPFRCIHPAAPTHTTALGPVADSSNGTPGGDPSVRSRRSQCMRASQRSP
jgi:hypothetical protein